MITNSEINYRISKLLPKKNEKISIEEKFYYRNKIKELLKKKKACLVAHYYVDKDIQTLAEETGGMLGDSLAMAKFGKSCNTNLLVVAGVRFMGESAKIISPEKKVIMPTLNAECSLDISCQVDDFKKFIKENPDRVIVVYVNTSAEIKALADWTVTSSNALDICRHLHNQGKKILWAPDKYLGYWIKKETNADILYYNGSCVVHEEFNFQSLVALKKMYPSSAILVHPESPIEVVELADFVGSTSYLLEISQKLENKIIIVATDKGILFKMAQMSPDKEFIPAPTIRKSSACHCCAKCPWMQMNDLKSLAIALENESNEIIVDKKTILNAIVPLKRMINFSNNYKM